jgi:hypothetical protein
MLKSLARLLRKKPDAPAPQPSAGLGDPPDAEDASIYQSLALTDEMREALFPTTPRMVSAIFDRTAPPPIQPAPAPPATPMSPARESGLFPII